MDMKREENSGENTLIDHSKSVLKLKKTLGYKLQFH